MTAADVIAARLHAAGVRHAFGIPGGEVLSLVDALTRAGIAFHLARHENAAGFMAEGAWHASGAPGVLVATVGPGIANAFNVVANAEQDRVPLLVLSGMVDPAEQLTYTHQVFEHAAVFARVTKASLRAEPGAVGTVIDKALAIAMEPRKGPVHVDLPVALAAAAEPAPGPVRRGPVLPTAPGAGAALDAARARLSAAERPVIVAGLDILEEPGGPAALAAFAERHGVPLVTTYKAKGVLPEDHPLCLGGHGLSPKSDAILMPALARSDCVIAAGYDPIEMRTGWRDPWDPEVAIEFAHAPNRHDMHHAALSWTCSVAGGLAALDGAREPGPDWLAETRAALRQAFAPGAGWGPDVALAELLEALPAEAVVTADSGAHRILLSQLPLARRPRALLQSTGLCTMGCALPLALGHAIAEPGRPAVAVMGDAGLEMILGELATLRDSGRPVVAVVLADRSLSLIEKKQRAMQLPNAGVDFAATDFAALARVYGGRGVTVRGPGEAGPALAEALSADRFTVIAVELPRRAYDGLF